MNRSFSCFLIVLTLTLVTAAQAAPRTVMFEHFSQEACLTCPIAAEAIASLRANYNHEDIAIISYWTQGSQAIPDGNNRGLQFYDEVITPSIVADGLLDIPNPPQTYDSLVDAYNSRSGTDSPCTMAVVNTGGNSYTIQIVAEQAFNGSLVVVAYSQFTDSHSAYYPCFAREFVTPYYGESISASAGQTLTINKTVTCPAHDGVVAWIHTNGKQEPGSRRFTAWEVIQSADSHAGGTIPTPTPTGSCTATPTPTSGTPTATPAIPCEQTGALIDMPSDFFRPGDQFFIDVYVCNMDSIEYNVPLFVILDVYGSYFFAPSFSAFDNYDITLPANDQIVVNVLPLFNWPDGAGEASGIKLYAAMTDPQITNLFGTMDMKTFGWGN